MENILDHGTTGDIKFSEAAQQSLLTTAKWSKFMAIVGFVFCALMVIIGLFAGALFSTMGEGLTTAENTIVSGVMSFMYIIFSLLYIYPTYQLYKFSTNAIAAINGQDAELLTESMDRMKKCFKFMGIMTAIVIGLYVIGFIFGGMATLML